MEMEQLSLFDDRTTTAPLASRLRPETLDEFVGQNQLLGEGKILRQIIDQDNIPSMIFWGPPGVGKPLSPASSPSGPTRNLSISAQSPAESRKSRR